MQACNRSLTSSLTARPCKDFELRRLLLSHELFPCMEIPPHKSLYSMGHHSKNHQVRCCSDCAAICPLGNVTSAAMHVTGQRSIILLGGSVKPSAGSDAPVQAIDRVRLYAYPDDVPLAASACDGHGEEEPLRHTIGAVGGNTHGDPAALRRPQLPVPEVVTDSPSHRQRWCEVPGLQAIKDQASPDPAALSSNASPQCSQGQISCVMHCVCTLTFNR